VSDAKTILKMIETVDPADAAKLFEICGRVFCYLHKKPFHSVQRGYPSGIAVWDKKPSWKAAWQPLKNGIPLYAMSRDALKSIRPVGWIPKLSRAGKFSPVGDDYKFCEWTDFEFLLHGEDYYNWKQVVGAAKSEELAELHAIIQAIKHERRGSGADDAVVPMERVQPLTEGYLRKGGTNAASSQIQKRPDAPVPMHPSQAGTGPDGAAVS
jgi:hypothetical protein